MPRSLGEEIAASYYRWKGYLVDRNVAFQPQADRNYASDIDVLAVSDSDIVVCQCKRDLAVSNYESGVNKLIAWFENATRAVKEGKVRPRFIRGSSREFHKVVVFTGDPPSDRSIELKKQLDRLRENKIEVVFGYKMLGEFFNSCSKRGYPAEPDPLLDLLRYIHYFFNVALPKRYDQHP